MGVVLYKPNKSGLLKTHTISNTYALVAGNAITDTSYASGTKKISLVYGNWTSAVSQMATAKYQVSYTKNLISTYPGTPYTFTGVGVSSLTGSSFSFTAAGRSFSGTAGPATIFPASSTVLVSGGATVNISSAYVPTYIYLFGYTTTTGYRTANRGLFRVSSMISLYRTLKINSVTLNQTTPAGTAVKWFFTLNGGTNWKYLNAGVPTNIALSLANLNIYGNTKAQIESYFANKTPGISDTALGFASQLSTSVAASSPTINSIQYSVLALG